MQDLYQRVTEKIISQLETGQPLPWIKPWKTTSEPFPVNAKTTRPYRGINVLMLQLEAQSRGFCRNRWVTYRQAQELGGQVRKGAKGSPVILYRPLEPSASSVPLTERDPLQSNDKRAVMRTFSVFNIEEVDGLQESSQPTPVADGWPPVMIAEGIFYDSGASFRYGGDRDLAAVALRAAERGVAGQVYHVGDGHPTTMTDYFFRIADHFGIPRPPAISYAEARKVFTPAQWSFIEGAKRLQVTRMRDVLGFTPRYTDLSQALAEAP